MSSSNPDFTKIPLNMEPKRSMSYEEWKKKVEKETGKSFESLLHRTMEQIEVAPLYTKGVNIHPIACKAAGALVR